ncbi:MAG: type II 3-dehydroquinate dehydratase [Actinomycetota bacterium]|nr:type II 3-dehydroquinate dehydratase [Actinomycetota bacterium]
MMKFLVLNGPNLNLLGVREPEVYGTTTLADIEGMVHAYADELGVKVYCVQSNHEGVLIDEVQHARLEYDGIVFNPAAFTHYSYALRDAVAAIEPIPVVEVHLSDISTREAFRRTSVIEPVCIAQVKGRGPQGYLDAIDILVKHLGRPAVPGTE